MTAVLSPDVAAQVWGAAVQPPPRVAWVPVPDLYAAATVDPWPVLTAEVVREFVADYRRRTRLSVLMEEREARLT